MCTTWRCTGTAARVLSLALSKGIPVMHPRLKSWASWRFSVKGISLNWVVDTATNTPTLPASDIAALQSSGARMARVDLHLGGNASWSPPLIAAYRSAIHSLDAAGLQVLGLLGAGIVAGASQEKWNTDNAENGGSGWNPFLDHYSSAARTV